MDTARAGYPRPVRWRRCAFRSPTAAISAARIACRKAVFAEHTLSSAKASCSLLRRSSSSVQIFIGLGVRKIRLTGGEPLLRPDIAQLIRKLVVLPGLAELALSTNALLLSRHAAELRDAGLRRLNISLDAIDDSVFGAMNGLGTPARQVLNGIDDARAHGFALKVNMVVQRGANEGQIVPMARHFAERGIPLRFIEFMDVGNSNRWNRDAVFSGAEIRELLQAEFSLEPQAGSAADTERRFRCAANGRSIWVHRLGHRAVLPRLQPAAPLRRRPALHLPFRHQHGKNLGALVRAGRDRTEIAQMIRGVWQSREDRYSELRATTTAPPSKVEMSYIGG